MKTTYQIQQRRNGLWQTLETTIHPSDARNKVSGLQAKAQANGGNAWAYRMKVAK